MQIGKLKHREVKGFHPFRSAKGKKQDSNPRSPDPESPL